MPQSAILKVTSDIRRDLLSSAALFKNEAQVVLEYVYNSLQYVDKSPRIQVSVNQKANTIEISDNGQGMSATDLEHFFRMHGENRERRTGRIGRGNFGTGKSAAFSIANCLRVDTRRDGLRNAVLLTRERIDRSAGDAIPLEWQVRNESTDLPNGTTITISEVFVPKLNVLAIVESIEHALLDYRALTPQVAVNDHVCEIREPVVTETFEFLAPKPYEDLLGDVTLIIKVAQAPLRDRDQGIRITAGDGNLVAVEKAGVDRKEWGNYLFGEIDVPKLETYDTHIAAYDSSRSLNLKPIHPVASALIAFIGSKLESVRLGLVAREREARKSEEARRLEAEADRIAEVLNQDFKSVQSRLHDIRASSATRGPATSAFGDTQSAGFDDAEWAEGMERPGSVERPDSPRPGTGGRGRPAPKVTAEGTPNPDGTTAVDPVGGTGSQRRKPSGGFRVRYKNLGSNENRSLYDQTASEILINLDHPVLKAASKESGTESIGFLRLSYEIAFSEYAMALGYLTARKDPDIPADDLLFEVRACLNRVSVASASLYR